MAPKVYFVRWDSHLYFLDVKNKVLAMIIASSTSKLDVSCTSKKRCMAYPCGPTRGLLDRILRVGETTIRA